MTALTLFGTSFVAVFLMGYQSLNVTHGHLKSAFVNSALIGVANLTMLKLGVNATGWEMVAYIAGGPFGIICSIKVFGYYRKLKAQK